jgi:hypothetical protein
LQFEAGLSSDPNTTPRAQAEPALNKWLAQILPPLDRVACKVAYYKSGTTEEPVLDPVTNQQITQTVTQQNLQLEPIDLLYLLRTDSEAAMTELDDRILLYVIRTFSPRPDILLKIQYTERFADNDNKISFFELAPMMHSLRSLILRSRPLKSSDIILQNQATQAQSEQIFVDRQRIDLPQSDLVILKTDVEAFKTSLGNVLGGLDDLLRRLDTLLQDADTNSAEIVATRAQIQTIRTQIIASVDDRIATAIDLLSQASRFGIPQSGWGFALDWKRKTFNNSLKQVGELVTRWQQRLNQFDDLLIEYNNLPATATDREKFDLLQQAERLISTIIINPLPATPNALRIAILVKRTIFSNKLDNFSAVLTTTTTAISTLNTNIEGLLPIADFDLTEFDVTETEKQIILFTTDLVKAIDSLFTEVDLRLRSVQMQLDTYNTNTQPTVRVQALQGAAKALLGEEFQLIPEIELAPDRLSCFRSDEFCLFE